MASARSQFWRRGPRRGPSRIWQRPRPRVVTSLATRPAATPSRPSGSSTLAREARRQTYRAAGQRVGGGKRGGLVGSVARLLRVLVALGDKAKDGTHGTGGVKVVVHALLKGGAGLGGLGGNASDAASLASAVAWFAAQRRFSTVPAIRVSEFSAPSGAPKRKSSGGDKLVCSISKRRRGRVLLEDLGQRKEVQRLDIFSPSTSSMPLHPGVGETLVPAQVAWAHLLVMREGKVGAAVNVDRGTQVAMHHGGALGVPTGRPLPGLGQLGSPGLAALHRAKSRGSFFVLVLFDARLPHKGRRCRA